MSKTKPSKIIAIDASTTSMAFAYFNFGKLEHLGKINFEGDDIYKKCIDATKKVKALFDIPQFINSSLVIEHTVFMNSPKTAADLALVQGAIIGAAGLTGVVEIGKVSPITWQNFIGNKKLNKEELLLIRKQNPGKSESWYKGYARGIRKERTIKFININYDTNIEDNDVADACGIGHWALNNWEKAVDK